MRTNGSQRGQDPRPAFAAGRAEGPSSHAGGAERHGSQAGDECHCSRAGGAEHHCSQAGATDRHPSQAGQASVEMVAVLPLVLLAGLIAWQLALAGHTLWLSAGAARVAARADTVGANAEHAARSALPSSMERDLSVERLRDGGVRVSVGVPMLLPHWHRPVRVSATSSLGRAR